MRTIIVMVLLTIPGLLIAGPHSYNTLDIDYVDAGLDPFDGDGFSIRGSGNIREHIYLVGQYSDVDTDSGTLGVDVERLSLGGGYQMNPNIQNLNLYGQLTFESVESDSNVARFNTDDSGFAVEVGARYAVMPKLEVTAAARVIDVGDYFDGNLGGTIGLVYDVLPWLGLSLDYDYNNIDLNGDRGEDERIMVGGRVYWDQLNLNLFGR